MKKFFTTALTMSLAIGSFAQGGPGGNNGGNNGGGSSSNCTFTSGSSSRGLMILQNGSYTGAVNADQYGTATVSVASTATWTGAMDNSNVAKSTTATISGTWILNADSYVDNLVINEGAIVYTNGYNLTYSSITNKGTLDTTSTNVTGINEITASGASNSKDGAIYNLQGQKVASLSSLPHGIYVMNGKKFMVK